ncbi:hypothetical protein Tco_1134715 [Tanacetum coccineum]
MTVELANRDICTPKGIARDVFVLVGKFTFPADFVIVDYESDPRVPLILGRLSDGTAHALIDVHGEEMILHDGNERLILNMRNDTSSYSNEPHQESINMIDVYNVSHSNYREDLFATNQPGNDDLPFNAESDLRELEYLLNHDPIKEMDSILEDSVDENSLDDTISLIPFMRCSPMNMLLITHPYHFGYSKILIDELDLPGLSDFLLFPECDSVFYEDFFEVDALPSTDNEDKIFNPGILHHETL